MKIYTKTGDAGQTSLVGGKRVSKSNLRLEAYGTVDELNSYIGLCVSSLRQEQIEANFEEDAQNILLDLGKLQHKLFNTGSLLACEDQKIAESLPRIEEKDLNWLEMSIDHHQSKLSPLKEFILPGGCMTSSYFQISRTIARRAERHIIKLLEDLSDRDPLKDKNSLVLAFINRVSDYLFVLARRANYLTHSQEVRWNKDC